MKAWTDPDGTLHEIYTGTLIADGEYLGGFSYDSGQAAYRWDRSSLAYFCPTCGEIWGRVVALNSKGWPQAFRTVEISCKNHPDPWNIPGSFLQGTFEGHLKELPDAAVRREFFLHLDFYEKLK